MSKYSLQVKDVHKTFRSGRFPVYALRGVDLEVPEGEVFGFLGPNGAGKTTLLRIVTTLLPFEKGQVTVAGLSVQENPQAVRTAIGYVSQQGGTAMNSTGWENLIMQGRLYGLSRQEAVLQAQSLVKAFSLEECVDRVAQGYSGGQKRRLDIALAMMHRPKILFLDEPTNGLDPQSRDNLWQKILELKREGITIFLTSHYLDEIDSLAESLAIMDHGKVVAAGSLQLLKKQISGDTITIGLHKDHHPLVKSLFETKRDLCHEVFFAENQVRLRVDRGAAILPQILRMMDQVNLPFESVQVAVPTLSDVFLKKTGRELRDGESS